MFILSKEVYRIVISLSVCHFLLMASMHEVEKHLIHILTHQDASFHFLTQKQVAYTALYKCDA